MNSLPQIQGARIQRIAVGVILLAALLLSVGLVHHQRVTRVVDRAQFEGVRFPYALRSNFLMSEMAAGEYTEPSEDVVNDADESIRVELIYRSCNCVGIEVDGEPVIVNDSFAVEPHGSRRLTIPVSRAARGSSSHLLRFEISREGDEQVRDAEMSVQINVWPDLVVTPALLELSPGATERKTIAVQRYSRGADDEASAPLFGHVSQGLALDMLALKEDTGAIHVAEMLWKRKWTYEVELSQSGSVRSPSDFREITVESALASAPLRHAGIQVRIRDSRSILVPQLIHFGEVAPGETRRRAIPLRGLDGVAFRVLSARAEPDFVVAEIDPEQESNEFQLVPLICTPPHGTPHGKTEGALLIETEHPNQKQIRVPFIALIQEEP